MNGDYGIGDIGASRIGCSAALDDLDGILGARAPYTALSLSARPFTSDDDEVKYRPAAQQWTVCTP